MYHPRIILMTIIVAFTLSSTVARAGEIEDYLALSAFREAGARAEFFSRAENFLREHPGSEKTPEILFLLGEWESDLFAATLRFKKIADEHPDSPFAPKALFCAGQVYYLYNDYSAAAQKFGLLTENYPEFPMAAEAKLWKAKAELAADHTKKARITAADLAENTTFPSLVFRAKLIEPSALFLEGKYQQAAEMCKHLLAEATNGQQLPTLLLLLGDSLLHAGDGEQAEIYYSRIVREFPNSPEATNAAMALR
jgi:outer membrane protein assembly factor BamD (BamD/ComL family)